MPGFKKLTRQGVSVSGSDRVVVEPLVLQVGGTQETVNVRADAPLLQAARPEEYTCARPLHYVLLRFAGKRFLHLDDDVLIEPRRPPLSRPGVDTSFGIEAAHWYESFEQRGTAFKQAVARLEDQH